MHNHRASHKEMARAQYMTGPLLISGDMALQRPATAEPMATGGEFAFYLIDDLNRCLRARLVVMEDELQLFSMDATTVLDNASP